MYQEGSYRTIHSPANFKTQGGGPVFPYRPGPASPFARHQELNLWGNVGVELSWSWRSHEKTSMRFGIVTHSQTSSENTALSLDNKGGGSDLAIPCCNQLDIVKSGQDLIGPTRARIGCQISSGLLC